MTDPFKNQSGAPFWSLDGVGEGVRLAAPVMLGMAVFGAAFGALAAQKGLTLLDATMMSAFVFAGASQFVAMEMWTDHMTIPQSIMIGLFAATVNMRFVLMTASLRPWLGELPVWQSYPTLFVITDPGWLIAMRYRLDGGANVWIILSGGVALWLIWVASTLPGYMLGALVSDPKRFGFDLVMPAFFVIMLIPLWHGPKRAVPWIVAGVTALIVAEVVPGGWFIIAGALAGGIAGSVLNEHS